MDKQYLASIELQAPREGQRGRLYWHDGDIWCETADGECSPTETGCESEADAVEVIQAAWGHDWGLEWIDAE